MINEMRRQYFIKAGLPELHIQFVERFLDTDLPTRQIAAIPVGGGRGHFLVALATFVASQDGRVLFLTDRVELIEQYRSRLQHGGTSSTNLDRENVRSLQAGAVLPRIQWRKGHIYTATVQFASAADVKHQILNAKWDLIIVDDTRSSRRLAKLIPSSSYHRLLILLSHFDPTADKSIFQGDEVRVLGVLNPSLQTKFELEVVKFALSQDEQLVIKNVLLLVKQLQSMKDLGPELRSKVMRQKMASSFYALELTLAHLRPFVQFQCSIAVHNPRSDEADLPQLVSALQLIDKLLIQLDELAQDGKQEAFSQLLERLLENHILVYTRSSDTANYLVQSAIRKGKRAHQLVGTLNDIDHRTFVRDFAEIGGIAVVSDVRRLTGYDGRAVLSSVVLYDVPPNEHALQVLISRMSPEGGRVYVLQDSTNNLGNSENQLQTLLTKLGLT